MTKQKNTNKARGLAGIPSEKDVCSKHDFSYSLSAQLSRGEAALMKLKPRQGREQCEMSHLELEIDGCKQ